MTAVVGILNKECVALAADSAVTVSGWGNRKIFNKANKIFRLSKNQPVGVMLYNSASFMGVPWEVILKVYREHLGNKAFPRLIDYQSDFIQFLKDRAYFSSQEDQDAALHQFSSIALELAIRESLQYFEHLPQPKAEKLENNPQDAIRCIIQYIYALLDDTNKTVEILPEWGDFEPDSFIHDAKTIIDHAINDSFKDLAAYLEENDKTLLYKFIFEKSRSSEFLGMYTGLIFAGYGGDEIFPSLTPLKISFVWKDRLRYIEDSRNYATISNVNPSVIRPFAQTDVIDTILSGIDPKLAGVFFDTFQKFVFQYNDLLLKQVGSQSAEIMQSIQSSLPNLWQEFSAGIRRIQQEEYIHPLMMAVGSLSKEDLAEMAESLIYLTYLKRRITFAEESVGGPVDVAIVSKGDGFIWIKRKHYFKPELNVHYFANYLPFNP